jgi:hypothetical protein
MSAPPPSAKTLAELFEEDGRRLIPDFQLYDQRRMIPVIDQARQLYDMPQASDAAICVFVLRDGAEEAAERDMGIPAAWWWITLAAELVPEHELHPWFEVGWWAFEKSRGKRETNTLWGSASTGKTQFFTSLALVNLVVWEPGDAFVFITGPWMNSSDDKIWGNIYSQCARWKDSPPRCFREIGTTVSVTDTECEFRGSGSGFASTVKFVSLRNAAAIQGQKQRVGSTGAKRGVLLVLSDELVKNPVACRQLAVAEGNVVSVANFHGVVAFNPLPQEVQHADALDWSAPTEVGVNALSPDTAFTWRTMRGTLYRFGWDNGPNRHSLRPIFPFLINEEQRAAQIARGRENEAGMVAAWGWGESSNGSAMTHADTQKPHLQKTPLWNRPPVRVLFVDPALGGNDPMVGTVIEFGQTIIDGKPRHVISGVEQFRIPVTRRHTLTQADWDDFVRISKKYGGRPLEQLPVGSEIDSKWHMTLGALRSAERLQIPAGHVSFDASQRADVFQPMAAAFGRVPWFYEGSRRLTDDEGVWPHWPPHFIPETAQMKRWSDEYGKIISVAWRFTERLVAAEKIYGLAAMTRGLNEMLGRPWICSTSTGKKDVLGKEKLGHSPCYGETLALSIYFAVRFCGALPDLFEGAQTVGGNDSSLVTDPLFAPRGARLDRKVWA